MLQLFQILNVSVYVLLEVRQWKRIFRLLPQLVLHYSDAFRRSKSWEVEAKLE
jgi:hypothetical protein